jgi:hypothetical protein
MAIPIIREGMLGLAKVSRTIKTGVVAQIRCEQHHASSFAYQFGISVGSGLTSAPYKIREWFHGLERVFRTGVQNVPVPTVFSANGK